MNVRALKRITKDQAYEAYKANPGFIKNRSAAARAWGVERGTIRNWEREWNRAATVAPPSPGPLPPTAPPVAPAWPGSVPATGTTSPPEDAPTATATRLAVPPATTRPVLRGLAYISAVSLTAVAAYFSVRGMVVLFPGQPESDHRHGRHHGNI